MLGAQEPHRRNLKSFDPSKCWRSGFFVEAPYVCHVHAYPNNGYIAPNGLCPIVGGEVAQPRRATRTATPQTIVIPLSNADVAELDLYECEGVVDEYPLPPRTQPKYPNVARIQCLDPCPIRRNINHNILKLVLN